MSQQLGSEVEWQGKANKSTTPGTAQRGLQYLVCPSVCDALSGTAALCQTIYLHTYRTLVLLVCGT